MYAYDQLKTLHSRYQSSFYLLDVNRLEENYLRMHRAFASRYDNVLIAYSYKTNYLPFLCKHLDRMGAYAEVVSRLEWDLALKIGVEPARIVFNGPLKRENDIVLALDQNSMVNLDSFSEIPWVANYAESNPHRQVKIGLRVNFDLSYNGVSPLQDGYDVSRFGFCVENGNFQAALLRLSNIPNITIVGLHGHFSTNRSIGVYRHITRQLCLLAKQYLGESLEYIDIGGGMYGELPASFGLVGVPTYEDYAEVICSVIREEMSTEGYRPVLILEPGVSLVADAFDFVCRVVDIKENRGKRFVLVDGSVHNVKPTMHRYQLPARIVSRHKNQREGVYHVVGYTCMEKDYLLSDYTGPLPAVDDFLVFGHVGAYTIVFNPPFIRERPPIFAACDHGLVVVRGKETLEEFFHENVYRFPVPSETNGGEV